MTSYKKRDRPPSEQLSPPSKMTKNSTPPNQPQQMNQPSNQDLMAQLNQLVATNTDMVQKIDNLEKRFNLVEKLFEEVETLKKEVERLTRQSKPDDGFRRFEVEQKKRSILVKGLPSQTTKKYETRSETYDRVSDLFQHIGLNLTLQDYQRLGPIKPEDSGSTMVRLLFWTQDDKSQLFDKFKEYTSDAVVKSISLINDYPLFQLAEVKRLSDEAYNLRKSDKTIKTRIVPRGLEVKLQTRRGTGKWMMVSANQGHGQNDRDLTEA